MKKKIITILMLLFILVCVDIFTFNFIKNSNSIGILDLSEI